MNTSASDKYASIIRKYGTVEPIALVGIGCRFPGGAHDPVSFWNLLVTGQDAIVDVPPERWNIRRFYDPDTTKPGKTYVRYGGFIRQRFDTFDAAFFGISPREAECMDPQQRLLLETSWEALEDAGIPVASIAGSNTGVFVGGFTLDHKLTQMGKMNRNRIGVHTAIGSTMTILSNRISYALDLCGPSVSMDTACSSSLVAFHIACQSIWHGECGMALVGGVSVMVRPEYPIAMCKGGFLSKDGRSKSFDASADGYGRGEGAGIVVLKPLSAALRDRDSIYAIVRGTGANQDGKTGGITVPNPDAQLALARSVCDKYAVDPQDIYYFEAHGTGTLVGDPLEAKALGLVVGKEREQKCMVGSVKATIGHLEAAAGVAGVIKTALCLAHRQVPPQANLKTPNPAIPFEEFGLHLPRQLEELAPGIDTVCAGVNSFGYGGTNAHALLQNPPALEKLQPATKDDPGKVYVLPLSARSDGALKDLASAWIKRFDENNAPHLADLCYSAICRRDHHNFRLAVTGDSWPEMRKQLQAFVENGTSEWLASGKVLSGATTKPVFVFTGMGPQWWAMGRELYHSEPVFRQALEECDAIYRRLAGWSILQEMLVDEKRSRMAETTKAQPSNFLLQVGIIALLRSLGVEPAAVVGHSVGEVTSAYAAGVLSLKDAMKVAYHRSDIQKKAAGKGKMLAVGIPLKQCMELLEMTEGKVSIAAINGPTAITLSGNSDAIDAIAAYLTELKEFNRPLQVEVAYHGPDMEDLKPEVRNVLRDLWPELPTIPFYSTVTGDLVKEITYDAEYWCDNIRDPVQFAKVMDSMLRDGHRVFLEVGPHPVLSTSIKECSRSHNIQVKNFASLRRGKPERRTISLALAGLYSVGCTLDWHKQYLKDSSYVKLPTYPWQRETYWSESNESIEDRIGVPLHPLLDRRLPEPKPAWQSEANRQFLPYLNDHRVDGLVVLPGAAYVEAFLETKRQTRGDDTSCVISDLRFQQALVLNSSGSDQVLRVDLDTDSNACAFFSRDHDDLLNWRRHAYGKLTTLPAETAIPLERASIEDRCQELVNLDGLYAELANRGLDYGPYFRTIRQLHRRDGEILAKIALHDDLKSDDARYNLHPTLLDGCFQSLIAALKNSDRFYMPVSIREFIYRGSPGNAFWCHGYLSSVTELGIEGDLKLFNEQGQVLAEVLGLRCRALITQKDDPADKVAQWAYTWNWHQQAVQPSEFPRTGNWIVFTGKNPLGRTLCKDLETSIGSPMSRITLADIYQDDDMLMRPLDTNECARLRARLVKIREAGCAGIAYLWGLDATVDNEDPAGIKPTSVALQVIQLLGEVFTSNAPRLYVVTQGIQPVVDADTLENLAQAPLVGLARVAFNEYPGLRCTLLDLDATNSQEQTDALRLELLANDVEDDVALRNGGRWIHRLEHMAMDAENAADTQLNGAEVAAFRMEQQYGRPVFRTVPLIEPKAGEVLVELLDVNLADGGATAADPDLPGYFAAGVIRKIGADVALQVGAPVLVAAEGSLASHLVMPTTRVFQTADLQHLPGEEIAALADTLVPTYYALHSMARVAAGETVLIDSAAGVVSLAAQQVTRWLGANALLIDQAGSEQTKTARAWIYTDPSRAGLADGLLATDGHSILLNRKGQGRVVAQMHPGVSYSRLNGWRLAIAAPDLFGQVLAEIAPLLRPDNQGLALARQIPTAQALEALASSSGHEEDVRSPVLSLRDKAQISVAPSQELKPLFDAQASYLITGGFGGFGLEAAHWMVKRGARHLVLMSRRGDNGAASKAAVQALERAGAKIMPIAADVSVEAHVRKALAQIAVAFPPLKGILHTAGVLDDAPMAEIDPQRLAKVMLPKALGAWHLHTLTQSQPLDFLVLFSSVSALIGNGRQANYCAANTFLDTLAWRRRSMGLPVASINWGAIATGMAVESAEIKVHLESLGMIPLDVAQALEAWSAMGNDAPAQYGLLDENWPRWRDSEPTGGNSPRFSKLMESAGAQGSQITDTCQAIGALPEEERAAAMGVALAEQIAKVLRLPAGKVDMDSSLAQMGVDSLLSVELQVAIHQTLGVRISTLELVQAQSLNLLASTLLEKARLSGTQPSEQVPTQGTSMVDRLSNEDVDILLNRLLAQKGE